nr:glycoprotein B [Macronycteris gammaherpesvirus 1]
MTIKSWKLLPLTFIFFILISMFQGDTSPTPTPPEETTSSPDATPTTPSDSQSHPFKVFLPFRVCSASTTGEIFRFPLEEKCPDTVDKHHVEGIALIYKTNIIPYMFKVRKYRKLVTSTTIYKGWYEDAITNQFTNSYPIPLYEANLIDHYYQCFNSITVNENGNINTYVDRDGYNETAFLKPVDGLTTSIRRFASQPEIYATPRALPGLYTTRTTVNCEVTEMTARSLKPFEYFVTASGDTVEMSPFINKNTSTPEFINKQPTAIHFLNNHTIATYSEGLTNGETADRFYSIFGDYSLSWKAAEKQKSHCELALWKGFSNAIQTHHNSSLHFIANDITASFSTGLEPEPDFNSTFSCVWTQIQQEMARRLTSVSKTHTSNGEIQVYKTSGGLYVAWQPLTQINLLEAHKALLNSTDEKDIPPSTPQPLSSPATSLSRSKREVPKNGTDGDTDRDSSESSIATSQLQFAYDSLRNSINKVLEDLSRAWCREQYRTAMMWFELSKINPTSVMSAIYGRPVSAKFIGDVISVSDCIIIDQTKVSIHKTLRVPGQNNMCYTRPLVSFNFVNGSETFSGQLGSRNEILLSTSLVETCRESCEHYFQFGDQMYKYVDYVYSTTVNMTEIPTLNTIMTLNLSLVENIDFQVIELYSKGEKRLANVLDIETMFREYNYYTQSLSGLKKDLANTVDNNRDAIIRTFGDIVQDLGSIGKVVVNVASGVFSLFGTIVTGLINFIKNPLGGMFTILLILGGVFIVYLLTKKTNQMYQAPIKMIYPEIEKVAKDHKVQPIENSQLESILLAMHQLQQQHVQKEKNEEKPSLMSSLSEKTSNFLRNRKGYTKVSSNPDNIEL